MNETLFKWWNWKMNSTNYETFYQIVISAQQLETVSLSENYFKLVFNNRYYWRNNWLIDIFENSIQEIPFFIVCDFIKSSFLEVSSPFIPHLDQILFKDVFLKINSFSLSSFNSLDLISFETFYQLLISLRIHLFTIILNY
jgi:hypothetical protein